MVTKAMSKYLKTDIVFPKYNALSLILQFLLLKYQGYTHLKQSRYQNKNFISLEDI